MVQQKSWTLAIKQLYVKETKILISSSSPTISGPPLRSTVVRASARGAGGRG